MTREQALEAALRLILQAADERRLTEGDCNEGRYALALPPDGVNADMLAALKKVADLCTTGAEYSGSAQIARNVARAAIARATGQEG